MQIHFPLQTLGDQEPLPTCGDALQSLHANDWGYRFSSRNGESRLANETWTQSSERSHGKNEVRALIETLDTPLFNQTIYRTKFYLFN